MEEMPALTPSLPHTPSHCLELWRNTEVSWFPLHVWGGDGLEGLSPGEWTAKPANQLFAFYHSTGNMTNAQRIQLWLLVNGQWGKWHGSQLPKHLLKKVPWPYHHDKEGRLERGVLARCKGEVAQEPRVSASSVRRQHVWVCEKEWGWQLNPKRKFNT